MEQRKEHESIMWLCEERCMTIREVSSGEEWEDDEVGMEIVRVDESVGTDEVGIDEVPEQDAKEEQLFLLRYRTVRECVGRRMEGFLEVRVTRD